jgi:hypothetical protein
MNKPKNRSQVKKTRGQSPRFFKEPTAISQYSQIHIWIILGKIGFKWFSAHAEGFLKAVLGASHPVQGQVSYSTLEHSGNH